MSAFQWGMLGGTILGILLSWFIAWLILIWDILWAWIIEKLQCGGQL